MTSRERAVRAYASLHRAYLRSAHPTAWRAMLDDGSLRSHCRRRGVHAYEMSESLSWQMMEKVIGLDGPEDYLERVVQLEAIPATVEELVLDDLRGL
ncbi:MAG: TnpV protein [Hyphomicrobiaceae bacterium]